MLNCNVCQPMTVQCDTPYNLNGNGNKLLVKYYTLMQLTFFAGEMWAVIASHCSSIPALFCFAQYERQNQ